MRMLAEGNSRAGTCAANLLACMQREVPFARSKGVDGDALDMPPGIAEGYIDESARDCLEIYEPRLDVDDLEFDMQRQDGTAPYTVTVIEGGEEEEDG